MKAKTVKAPTSASTVVKRIGITPGRTAAASLRFSGSLVPTIPRGSRHQRIAPASAPSPAMAKKVPRQPAMAATSAPSGAPTATATVVPPTTTAIARAR